MLSFSQTTLIFAMETSLVVFNVSSSVFQEYYTHVLCSFHIINPYSQCKSMLWPLSEIYLACESLLILFKFFVLNYIIIQKWSSLHKAPWQSQYFYHLLVSLFLVLNWPVLAYICIYLLSWNYLYISCFYISHFVQRKLSQKLLSISWYPCLNMSWVGG